MPIMLKTLHQVLCRDLLGTKEESLLIYYSMLHLLTV